VTGNTQGLMANQEVRFAVAADRTRIAYARHTSGGPNSLPLVRAAHWLSHLEYDWQSPIWHYFLGGLARDRTLVRYDERGTGLSDREARDLSFEAMVGDLEAVVDTLDLEQFALLGMSQGAAIAIAYAARHPERVAGIVICGGYARGHAHRGRTPEQRLDAELLLNLIRVGWGGANPKFRRVFATMFVPDASPEQVVAFDELQRLSAAPEAAYRLRRTFDDIDVTEACKRVRSPALVMHARDDGVVPFEEGRLLAGLIPGSRFVPLEGRNHILLAREPGTDRFFAELRSFLAKIEAEATKPAPATTHDNLAGLTDREREILTFVGNGLTNAEIALTLVLSPRTVERHLSNVYAKLGLDGKAARAAAAVRAVRARR